MGKSLRSKVVNTPKVKKATRQTKVVSKATLDAAKAKDFEIPDQLAYERLLEKVNENKRKREEVAIKQRPTKLVRTKEK